MKNFNSDMPVHIVNITDTQLKPGEDISFMWSIGAFIKHKQYPIVNHIGDLADMTSLCSYDKGKLAAEGVRYKHDIASAILGQDLLKDAMGSHQPWSCLELGNHDWRIEKAAQQNPEWYGTLDVRKDLKLADYWNEVADFLEVVKINGIAFSHYFTTGTKGLPCGSARQQLYENMTSCVAGHKQGRESFTKRTADGKLMTSIIAGSCYTYDMDYLGRQGNNHWRGIVVLHNAFDGQFDEMFVPIKWLMEKFPHKPVIYRG